MLANGHWAEEDALRDGAESGGGGGNESHGCRFDVLEYTVPVAAAANALRQYAAKLAEQRLFVSFPVDVRFSARDDDCWLSPTYVASVGVCFRRRRHRAH